MTESDWLTSTDPAAMLAQFVPPGGRSSGSGVKLQSFPISYRKLRLWATAWWSQWQPHEQVHALRVKEVLEGKQDWRRLVAELDHHGLADPERRKVEVLRPVGAALLREVCGNPYCERSMWCPHLQRSPAEKAVLALARSAYEERVDVPCGRCKGRKVRPGEPHVAVMKDDKDTRFACEDCRGSGFSFHGALDPGTLAVLADALEEAGCTDAAILRHLRGWERCRTCLAVGPHDEARCQCSPGYGVVCERGWVHNPGAIHVRGCWAVDALLGEG